MQTAPYSLPGIGRIPLRDRRGQVRAWATVDLIDFKRISSRRWHVGTGGYAVCMVRKPGGGQWTWGMHRAVLGLGYGDPGETDHKSRYKLDNRRSNLRVVDSAGNAQNVDPGGMPGSTSRYRGVSWWERRGKWVVQIVLDRKRHFLGYFDDEDEAGAVAAAWRREHMPFSSE